MILCIDIYEIMDNEIHTKEIDNIFNQDISMNQHNYIGYIEIERLNLKREIVLGINEKNLINHVTLSESSKSLDSDNVILAGHSINNIFGKLHNVVIDDIITITTFENKYQYIVTSIQIVKKTDISVIDNSPLILITCMNDNQYRLIIKAKRV
jgi:LPXTG-site transpeptidase (sortase) family protein